MGYAMAQLVEELRYKRARFPMVSLEFDNSSGRTMGVGSTHPLTEMSTGNISWG